MIDESLLHRLEQIVGAEHVLHQPTTAEVYSYDASLVTGRPDAVILPADTAQTADVVRELARAGVPLVPRGFGTNLSGGSIAAGGGVVKAVISGRLRLESLEIDPQVMSEEDTEMLQDLVAAAVNEGLEKAQEMASSRMSSLTGGLNIPGLT